MRILDLISNNDGVPHSTSCRSAFLGQPGTCWRTDQLQEDRMSRADDARDRCGRNDTGPACQRGDRVVEIRAGDVHGVKPRVSRTLFAIVSSVIVTFSLSSCGGGGGGAGPQASAEVPVVLGQPGPGDAGNHFPFTVGNAWNFQANRVETGQPQETFLNGVTITGTRQVNGVTATVFLESNPANLGVPEETFLVNDANGIANFGNADPTDTLTPRLVPFWELRFPLQAGASFVSLDRRGVDFGEDLDLDGVNERVDLRSDVTVVGLEAVTVPVGTFAGCARVQRTLTLTITLSEDRTTVAATEVGTAWFAPGVGWVKRVETTTIASLGLTETTTEELMGFSVEGTARGILPGFTITGDVTGAVGFDGTNYLLVSSRDVPSPGGLFGRIVSESGQVLSDFQITAAGANPAVAFDGSNYLVTFDREGQIFGNRVSPTGTVLDGPSGFQISTSSPGASTNFSSAAAFDGLNYLVVWNKFVVDNHEIFGRLVTPAGQVLDEFQVFSAPGEQVFPSIAFDGTNYLVAWRDTRTGSGPSADTDIFGVRVSPSGVVLDPGGIAIVTAPGFQGDQPKIAFDGTNYLVVWSDIQTLGVSPPVDGRIMGRRISTAGTLLGGPADSAGIAITTIPSSHSPTVAFDGTNFMVAWAVGSYPLFPPAGIFAARVSTDGILIDGPPENLGLTISGPPPSGSAFAYPVITSGGRNSLLTWVRAPDTSAVFIYPF